MNNKIIKIITTIAVQATLLSLLSSKTYACSGIPLKGNYALGQNCTLGGATVGVTGDLSLYTGQTGYQLAILDGQSAMYTGKINIGNGYISVASGGSIKNQDTYVVDSDGDGWPATGFNTQTGAGIYAAPAAGRIARAATTSNVADYNDANASIQTYSYAYGQAWYYTYAQAWYYTYAQAWYYTYGQSNYWRYGYGQSWYYSQSSYSYRQSSYSWRKAV